ncbi:MAG: hypothetical protein GY938_30875 [Ketobacter sp.]|nr:hypothetical protein [Ketobacter sp.]
MTIQDMTVQKALDIMKQVGATFISTLNTNKWNEVMSNAGHVQMAIKTLEARAEQDNAAKAAKKSEQPDSNK